jgi:hypothetical protein
MLITPTKLLTCALPIRSYGYKNDIIFEFCWLETGLSFYLCSRGGSYTKVWWQGGNHGVIFEFCLSHMVRSYFDTSHVLLGRNDSQIFILISVSFPTTISTIPTSKFNAVNLDSQDKWTYLYKDIFSHMEMLVWVCNLYLPFRVMSFLCLYPLHKLTLVGTVHNEAESYFLGTQLG